ncbi:polysaccharide pyruvyl transferase family protein [Streptomyces sp. CA-288835]|uniref:polysaccharide pyruvyl transferase family protein n=1 Tax=Streptomyces sp. CA-288835 TaxID=3240069 RepID=UPI003D939667
MELGETTAVKHADAPAAEVFTLGSVLQRAALEARDGTAVIGSGLPQLDPSLLDRVRRGVRRLNLLAVRGPETRKILKLPQTTTLGDPALLLEGRLAPSERRSGGVVVAHYSVRRNARTIDKLESHAQRLNARVVYTSDPLDDVLPAIGRAEWVLTSSLHGLVVADVVKTPAMPLARYANNSSDFRFYDYGGSVGRDVQATLLQRVTSADVLDASSWPRPDAIRVRDVADQLRSVTASWFAERRGSS